jgi:hypothetical protein
MAHILRRTAARNCASCFDALAVKAWSDHPSLVCMVDQMVEMVTRTLDLTMSLY